MTSDSVACTGYFTDHRNSTINNYFTSSGGSGGNVGRNSSSRSSSGGDGSGNIDMSNHHNSGSRGSSTSNSSANSSNNGNNSSTTSANRWNESGSGSGSSSSNENQQQQPNSQHNNQNINSHETQQQRLQQHEHHHNNHNHQHHSHQQQNSQQHNNSQQQIQQNLIASSTNNCHLIFGSGNFHHRSNNSWSMPSISSCYQRIYGDNHYIHGFNQNVNNNNNNNNSINNNNNNSTTQQHQNSSNNEIVANQLKHHQQHLQNNKRFLLNSGKSGNSKDICGDDKFKEDGDPWNVEAQAAFLGPNLWDKTLPYDADLKVTQYADLDEFLSENNIPDGLPGTHLGHSAGLGHRSDSLGHSAGLTLGLGHVTKRERSPSPSDCVSPDTINPPSPAESTFSFASSGRDFDPRTRAFSDEELKPQPMIKKSRKQFVPDELKDDKYWARRRKNNIAAKRSRDARRQKENQIAMRARYLEKENATLHQEVEQLKQENMELRARLSKYQEV